METEQLRAFIAIARWHSFSEAASQLRLTQPAVSKRIAALEHSLGASLFDRSNKGLRLTEAGSTLLPRAEGILLEFEQAKKAITDLAGEVRGELRLATSHHLGLHKLPPVLRQFCAAYPEVNLQLEFLDSEIALDRVVKGACELAVITLPVGYRGELDFKILWADPLSFVTHPDSPLLALRTLSELSAHPAILPDLTTYTGRLIKQCFTERNLPIAVNMATNYLETIKMMVSVGLGWSVLPTTMLDDQLGRVPIEDAQISRNLGLVKHPRRLLSRAAEAFYNMLCANSREATKR